MASYRRSDQPLIENGGMFTSEQIEQLSKNFIHLYGGNEGVVKPLNLAMSMVDTYRGMNKHFIPTNYELARFQTIFDPQVRGAITQQDVLSTARRLFLANPKTTNRLGP